LYGDRWDGFDFVYRIDFLVSSVRLIVIPIVISVISIIAIFCILLLA
jgi:hypothetical protein